jgi:hypothetical protein
LVEIFLTFDPTNVKVRDGFSRVIIKSLGQVKKGKPIFYKSHNFCAVLLKKMSKY